VLCRGGAAGRDQCEHRNSEQGETTRAHDAFRMPEQT
jgi:hypothetical protein